MFLKGFIFELGQIKDIFRRKINKFLGEKYEKVRKRMKNYEKLTL